MSSYMVTPVQPALVASLALRYNRADILGWIESKPALEMGFENSTKRLVDELTTESSDQDIIKALVELFSATNFHSIAEKYDPSVASQMSCTEEELEAIREIAGEDISCLPQLALNQYISVALESLERDEVKTLIDTTSKPQYLMWFANLRYQSVDFEEFFESAFSMFFNHVAGVVSIQSPEYAGCEWSLDHF